MAPAAAAAAAAAAASKDDQPARRSKRVSDRNKRKEPDEAGESDVKQVVNNKKVKTNSVAKQQLPVVAVAAARASQKDTAAARGKTPPSVVATKVAAAEKAGKQQRQPQVKTRRGALKKDESDDEKEDEPQKDEPEKNEPDNGKPVKYEPEKEEVEDEPQEKSDEDQNVFWQGEEVQVGEGFAFYSSHDHDHGTCDLESACERVRFNHRTCKKLTLNNNLSDDDAELVGKALSENTHLEALFLNCIHNSLLTVNGVKLLTDGIKASCITKCVLDLSHTRRVIHDALLHGLQQSKTIVELHIQADESDTIVDRIDLEAALTSMPSLQLASFMGSRFNWLSLAAGIRRTSVKGLKIYQVDYCLRTLCPALAANSSITALSLQYNMINDDDVAMFVEHWSPTSPIQELRLGINEFGSRGLERLLTAALHRPALKMLDLSENKSFLYAGLEYIGNEFLPRAGSSFTKLNLSCCSGHDRNAERRKRASQALINGMKANCFLKEVDVSYNELTVPVVNEIKFYAHLNRQGRYLLRTEHGLPASIWCHVFAKGGNASNIFYYLTELPTLVRSGNQTI